jgi:hypothetical protein
MNTTFAFYPVRSFSYPPGLFPPQVLPFAHPVLLLSSYLMQEMRTILRTYHAVPSLQHNPNSRKFLQDAPRMKASLKGVLLEEEKGSIPYTLPEVIRRKVR